MRATKPPIWLLMSATVCSQMALTIFLPSLPTIAGDLGVSYGTAQLTLSIYLFAFAFAQLAVARWAVWAAAATCWRTPGRVARRQHLLCR